MTDMNRAGIGVKQGRFSHQCCADFYCQFRAHQKITIAMTYKNPNGFCRFRQMVDGLLQPRFGILDRGIVADPGIKNIARQNKRIGVCCCLGQKRIENAAGFRDLPRQMYI